MATTDDDLKTDSLTSESEDNPLVPTNKPVKQADRSYEGRAASADSETRLPPIVEDYLKRITAISVGVIFLSVVMMMVTGGRLASQVDALQAATLSLTKRVVNMNSALEQVSVLDSKLELLDLGHASLIDSNSEADQAYIEVTKGFSSELSKFEATIVELDNSALNVATQISGIAQSISGQEKIVSDVLSRLARLEKQISSLKGLERDIQVLVEIEQGNLKELFRQQLELEHRKVADKVPMEGASEEAQEQRLDGVVTYSTNRE
ncbi:MAG: hypothetical protein CMQ07_03025 [Gammaproteobacteria bacterium]|nr:hypothetical protein [Gammaproteobacteria bacterium]